MSEFIGRKNYQDWRLLKTAGVTNQNTLVVLPRLKFITSSCFFPGAIEEGYGQCSCLRIVDQFGTTYCALLIGKSRVSPIKIASMSWLELAASTLSIKMSKLIRNESEIRDLKKIF